MMFPPFLAFRSINVKHFSHYIETTVLQTSEASQMEKFSVVIFDEGAMNIQVVLFFSTLFLFRILLFARQRRRPSGR